LTLSLTHGSPVVLTGNSAACNDGPGNCLRFELAADLPTRHAYLVAKSGYEGCADLLLIDDRSGRQTTFGAAPVFSPDSQRLLIQNECEADDHDNHFEIWRRRGDGWALEWAYTDKQAYAADPILEGPYHTEVTAWVGSRVTLAFSTREGSRDHGRAWTGTLEHDSEGWKLLASPPPSK